MASFVPCLKIRITSVGFWVEVPNLLTSSFQGPSNVLDIRSDRTSDSKSTAEFCVEFFCSIDNCFLVHEHVHLQHPRQCGERFAQMTEEKAALPTAQVEATLASTIPAQQRSGEKQFSSALPEKKTKPTADFRHFLERSFSPKLRTRL